MSVVGSRSMRFLAMKYLGRESRNSVAFMPVFAKYVSKRAIPTSASRPLWAAG